MGLRKASFQQGCDPETMGILHKRERFRKPRDAGITRTGKADWTTRWYHCTNTALVPRKPGNPKPRRENSNQFPEKTAAYLTKLPPDKMEWILWMWFGWLWRIRGGAPMSGRWRHQPGRSESVQQETEGYYKEHLPRSPARGENLDNYRWAARMILDLVAGWRFEKMVKDERLWDD